MSAKVTVSVRVDPDTLMTIDSTAMALGTSRGRLISDVLDRAFGSEMNPLEMAKAIVEGNAAKVADYVHGVEREALDAMPQSA